MIIRLIWIGRNDVNVGKQSSKGYMIEQEGRNVTVTWGPIESVGGMGGKLRWTYDPRQETYPFKTSVLAIAWATNKMQEQLKGYQRLHHNVKISS